MLQIFKASLQFSQNDISLQQEKIGSPASKKLSKIIFRRPLSWKTNLRFKGVSEDPNEKWDNTEEKIKNVVVEKLDCDSASEIDRAHRTGSTAR